MGDNPFLEEAAIVNTAGNSSNDNGGAVLKLASRIEELEASSNAVTELMRGTAQSAVQAKSLLGQLTERLAALEAIYRREIVIKVERADGSLWKKEGPSHAYFVYLLKLAVSLQSWDRNIWITGPAGSGKTTACHKLAEALDLPFGFHGAIDSPYKLSGFRDANGRDVMTIFKYIYKNGGIVLLDESDASSPGALLEINAATANGWASFPEGIVERHPDCYVLCAANTWGFGGDANYVGRAKLDAAFLDRFVTLNWPYDESLEAMACGLKPRATNLETFDAVDVYEDIEAECERWTEVVRTVRARVFELGAQVVISPRASIKGCQLLRAYCSRKLVVEAVFARYRGHSAWSSFGQAAEDYAKLSEVEASPSVAVPSMRGLLGKDPIAMTARYDGQCQICGHRIYRGDYIYYKDGIAVHEECFRK